MLDWISRVTGAQSAVRGERIQSLWSGYGEVVRVVLTGAPVPSVVVKQVEPPSERNHPRGWSTGRSHERKLRSYDVELAWYRDWSSRCSGGCRVPELMASEVTELGWCFVLEDLDAAGFPGRPDPLSGRAVERCLAWLAGFHGTFLGSEPKGLWSSGTYWHLATRPDELRALENPRLLEAASALDARLSSASFQTLVHGDAKAANFCFSEDASRVAAVDFQYVGGGCGMKDVAYFLSSCLDSDECAKLAPGYLDFYFDELRSVVRAQHPDADVALLEAEWRDLYAFAWADFQRFLEGWAPSHWKLHGYAEQMTQEALARL